MKVLMIAPYPNPGTAIQSGVATVTYNLVEGFKQIPEVELLILSTCQDKEEEIHISSNVTVRFVKSIYRSRKAELRNHIKPLLLSLERDWNPDIIHIQGNGSSLLLYDKSIRHKLVITQHGIIRNEMRQTKQLRNKFNMFLALMIERRIKRHITNWVFISRYNRDLFSKTLGKINSVLAYNPVNPKYFVTGSPQISKELKLLFVGRLVPRKGLKDLLVGINTPDLKNRVTLHVVGGFDSDSYRKEITDYIDTEGLGECVRMHGWLTSEEIIAIENECSTLVLPSYQETLPCVIAEAMAMGKTVISTKIGGIPEMVDEGETGFLYDAGDVKGLRKAILRLSSLSAEQHNRMSKSAIKKAKKLYDPGNIAKQHIDFYQSIIN